MGLARNCPTHRSTEDLQGPAFEAQEEPRRSKIIFRSDAKFGSKFEYAKHQSAHVKKNSQATFFTH